MEWDEKCFGLEYDLNTFNIVATDDFNMGAMENKGLNVFNTSCLLADPKIATDDDYERVMGVVAHEYFHKSVRRTIWLCTLMLCCFDSL